MQSEFRATPTTPQPALRSAPKEQVATLLAALERRFSQFRAEHVSGTRVPEELRLAALAVLSAGAKAGAVKRRCGLSNSQLGAWRLKYGGGDAVRDHERENVRVFAVEHAEPSQVAHPVLASEPEEPAMELRLGSWSVTVRHSGQQSASRSST